MKQHLGKFLLASLLLWLAFILLVPVVIWDGATWITIYVEVYDATTGKPISGAVVASQTELRTQFPEAEANLAAIPSAQTDAHGCAVFKEMFPAGGDRSGTGVHVGKSSVHCEVPGYVSADMRISDNGGLHFRKFLLYEKSHSATVRFALQRQ